MPRTPKPLTFDAALRAWRKASGGLSMAEAARRLAVPYRTWQDWELGNKIPPVYRQTAILASLRDAIESQT